MKSQLIIQRPRKPGYSCRCQFLCRTVPKRVSVLLACIVFGLPNLALGDDSTIDTLAGLLTQWQGDPNEILAHEVASRPLTRQQAERAKQLLVEAHTKHVRETRKEEYDRLRVTWNGQTMAYHTETYGDAPSSGHSLYISMHGGGNAPPRVNDRQWENQKKLYRLEEGIYVAPRAPTNTWNLWHEAHIDPLFTRLIENMIAFADVDPDRVYLTGYSAGGDGVYQLAPRMADQLAAAAMMAGHPNETRPDGLRNLPFTLHVGANDRGYDRNQKAKEWQGLLRDLRETDPEGYVHWVEIHADKGHWMDRQDAKGVAWMAQFRRSVTPSRVVWLQDDVIHPRYYWLRQTAEDAVPGQKTVATRHGNQIQILECPSSTIGLLLRDEMVDLDQDIEVMFEGRQVYVGRPERKIAAIAQTLFDRGDPQSVFSATLDVRLD